MCPLTEYARRLCEECDGDFGAARDRACSVEICHIDNDTKGLVDIFDAIAPSFGAQSVAGQAERLVAKYGKDAINYAKCFIRAQAPFPRKGLAEAVQARLDLVLGSQAVRKC